MAQLQDATVEGSERGAPDPALAVAANVTPANAAHRISGSVTTE
jgi:hypothetical protein